MQASLGLHSDDSRLLRNRGGEIDAKNMKFRLRIYVTASRAAVVGYGAMAWTKGRIAGRRRYNKALLLCTFLAETDRPMNSPENPSPDDEVLCFCSGTKRGDIRRLFEQGMDLPAISQWSGALTGCGGCEWDIEVFLQELAEQRKSADPSKS